MQRHVEARTGNAIRSFLRFLLKIQTGFEF